MEVHQHSHSPRKNWTHYFWEFLMLFLAVFCGFLAEYQLEHKIEKDREKQFTKLLYRDIKFDTSSLNSIIKARVRKGEVLDSFSKLLVAGNLENQSGELYYFARYATRFYDIRFIPNDGTLQQLKNAGNLRLIHKPSTAIAIIQYDVSLRNVLALFQQEASNREEYMKTASFIFDGTIFDSLVSIDIKDLANYGKFIRISSNPPFNHDKEKLYQLRYWIHYMKGNNLLNLKANLELRQRADSLLTILRNDYRLN
jgi:hypothetical protein